MCSVELCMIVALTSSLKLAKLEDGRVLCSKLALCSSSSKCTDANRLVNFFFFKQTTNFQYSTFKPQVLLLSQSLWSSPSEEIELKVMLHFHCSWLFFCFFLAEVKVAVGTRSPTWNWARAMHGACFSTSRS